MRNFRTKQPNSTDLSTLSIVPTQSHGPSLSSLPFGLADVTAGTENELQAIVVGKRNNVDLPVTVERSKYFANIARRVAFGEASPRLVQELEGFLKDNPDQVWDNSWVRTVLTHGPAEFSGKNYLTTNTVRVFTTQAKKMAGVAPNSSH